MSTMWDRAASAFGNRAKRHDRGTVLTLRKLGGIMVILISLSNTKNNMQAASAHLEKHHSRLTSVVVV